MFWWITSPWKLHFRLGSKEYCIRKSVETILWILLNVSLMFHPFFLEIYSSSCIGRFLSSFRKWNVKQNLGSIQPATVLPNAQNAIFKMGMWARGHSWPIKTWMEKRAIYHLVTGRRRILAWSLSFIRKFWLLLFLFMFSEEIPQAHKATQVFPYFEKEKVIFSAATASCREYPLK